MATYCNQQQEELYVIAILSIAELFTEFYRCERATYFNPPKYILSFEGVNFDDLRRELISFCNKVNIQADYSLDTMSVHVLLHHPHFFLEC